MRKESIIIYERQLMRVVAGLLYEMAPNRQPRKSEIIMSKLRDKFREIAYNENETYTLEMERDKFKTFIKDLLFSIPEFNELNLSQNEYENNIDVNDENRAKFKVITAFDVETRDSWKTDFIDLDAFVGNCVYLIYKSDEESKECFLCMHSTIEDNDICLNCSLNNNLVNKYESSRKPKGRFTFSCKYNCYRSFQICCEECQYKKECDKKCESCSSTCGLTIR